MSIEKDDRQVNIQREYQSPKSSISNIQATRAEEDFFVMDESIVVKCTQELKPNFLQETAQIQKWMETMMEYLVKGIQDFKVSFSSLVVL